MSAVSLEPTATSASRPQPRRKWFGLLTRSERWHLSGRAWLLFFIIVAVSGFVFIRGIYPFLAVERPLQTDALVVEGWVHPYAAREAAAQFQRGGYRIVYTTGGPVVGSGSYTNDFNTYASVVAELLIANGVPREQVQMVPSREAGRDRTYHSALTLRRWLDEHGRPVARLNVMTETTHARRSQFLFQKALEPEVEVGVIPIANPDFDPAYWWRYSEGVREVLSETIAYIYARFFFSPSTEVSG